jgi:hypothetical protein
LKNLFSFNRRKFRPGNRVDLCCWKLAFPLMRVL